MDTVSSLLCHLIEHPPPCLLFTLCYSYFLFFFFFLFVCLSSLALLFAGDCVLRI